MTRPAPESDVEHTELTLADTTLDMLARAIRESKPVALPLGAKPGR
jgi:hypothetical protein